MKFWTCGPFKEAADKLEMMVYKAEQMRIFMETIEESKKVDDLILNGSTEEKLIARMVKLDIDNKLEILIGKPDGHEEKDDEIPRETILESFEGITEK